MQRSKFFRIRSTSLGFVSSFNVASYFKLKQACFFIGLLERFVNQRMLLIQTLRRETHLDLQETSAAFFFWM